MSGEIETYDETVRRLLEKDGLEVGDAEDLRCLLQGGEDKAKELLAVLKKGEVESLQQVVVMMVALKGLKVVQKNTVSWELSSINVLYEIQTFLMEKLYAIAVSTKPNESCTKILSISLFLTIHGIFTDWLNILPYGRDGSVTYHYLFLCQCSLEGQPVSSLQDNTDSRRIAEIAVWKDSEKTVTSPLSATSPRNAIEDGSLLFRHPDSVPPEAAWGILQHPERVLNARLDDQREEEVGSPLSMTSGVGDRMTRFRELVGKWYTETRTFEIKSHQSNLLYSETRGGTTLTAILKQAGHEEVPTLPLPNRFQQHSFSECLGCVLGNGSVVWFTPRGRSGQGSTPSISLFSYHSAQEIIGLNNDVPNAIEAVIHSTKQTALKGETTVVIFATRMLFSVLKHPPGEGIKGNINAVFKSIPGMVPYFIKQFEEIDVSRYHPSSITAMLQVLKDTSRFTPAKWFSHQASRRPNVSLVSVLGKSFAGLSLLPADAVSTLRQVASNLPKTSGLLGIVPALAASVRHGFDGVWDWVGSAAYECEILPYSFSVTGHYVELHHPTLSDMRVTHTECHADFFSFTLVTSDKTKPSSTVSDDFDDSPNAIITVTINGSTEGGVYSGKWSTGFEDHVCVFVKREEGLMSECNEWPEAVLQTCSTPFENLFSGWDAAILELGTGSHEVLCHTIPDPLPSCTSLTCLIMKLWSLACTQILRSPIFTTKHHDLDTWVLTAKGAKGAIPGSLASLEGDRRTAAGILLTNYFSIRKIEWSAPPVEVAHLEILEEAFPECTVFIEKLRAAHEELQARLDAHTVTHNHVKHIEKHVSVYIANGLSFSKTDLNFEGIVQKIDKVTSVLRELIGKWGVVGAADELSTLEDLLRRKDVVELATLEAQYQQAADILRPVLELGASNSPLLRAQFVSKGPVQFQEYSEKFSQVCKQVASFTLDTPCSVALSGLSPENCRYKGGTQEQEERLFTKIGCEPMMIKAIVHGAVPLRAMVTDLRWFRKLVLDPPPALKLHRNFFVDEKDVLVNLDPDSIPLHSAIQQAGQIVKYTHGCNYKVLRIIRTILQCENLVRFTRCNPEAQDAGLSRVLSNSKDMQHATFQTFLDCCNYINPFVAASDLHVKMYLKQQERVKEGKEAGVALRYPIRCSGCEVGGTKVAGLWEALNNALCDTGHENIAAIEKLLLATSEEGTIAELENMVKQQNGTTDKLVEVCRGISGTLCDDTATYSQAALIVIHLPSTGQPSLECIYDGVSRNGAEYQDLAYRATLQKELCRSLTVFANQAREVLRAFNAACKVHSEGHLEFRSRRLSFRHDHTATVTPILQGLQGQWASRERDHSVLYKVCHVYPELSCLSPAELVRMAELIRSVTAIGEMSLNEALKYATRWRTGRSIPMLRGETYSCGRVENMVQKVDPKSALYETKVLTSGIHGKHTPIEAGCSVRTVSGVGEADGEYVQGLWMYQKHDDTAVLCPVNNGWSIYEKSEFKAKLMLCSVATHDNRLAPWEMGDWREAAASGDLQLPANLSVSVNMDDGYTTIPGWSQECKTRDETVVVSGVRDLGTLGLKVVSKAALYFSSVVPFSVWESMGFEPGMRIIGINGERGDGKTLLDLMHRTIQSLGFLAITVVPAWVWTQVSKDVEVSPNGRGIRKVGTMDVAGIGICPAAGYTWRVKVSGDAFGMRVGLCCSTVQPGTAFDVSAESSDKIWWYSRNGTLKHKGVTLSTTRSYRSGDIITVIHEREKGVIQFELNGEPLHSMFTETPDEPLHPITYLQRKTASVELSPGAPVTGVMKWNAFRKSELIDILDDGVTAHRKVSQAGTYGAVIGDTVFRGPGPHVYELKVTGRDINDCFFGLAPPGVFLHKQFDKQANFFGLTLRPDGNIFGLKENKILLSLPKKSFTQGDRITFIADLGVGSIEILCNGERVMHSSMIEDLPKVKGPLVPYCVFGNQDVKCTLLSVSSAFSRKRPTDPPSVVVKGASLQPPSSDPRPTPNGVYHRALPTYVRKDGGFHIFHWDKRWCVADKTDKPIAWSNECNGEHPLGSKALRWTVIKNFEKTPKWLRLVVGGVCRTLLKLVDTREVTYESPRGNEGLRLSWKSTINRWVVGYKKLPESRKIAVYAGLEPTTLPHYCTSWAWSDGTSWHPDGRVSLLPCDEPLKCDSDGMYWSKTEYGKGWGGFTPEARNMEVPGKAACFLGVDIKIKRGVKLTCRNCLTPCKHHLVQGSLESMTNQELAGWHIMHNVIRSDCRAPELRLLLQEAADGLSAGLELVLSSKGKEAAIAEVGQNAEKQLEKIGMLLRRMGGAAGEEGRLGFTGPNATTVNFDMTTGKYGRMQSKTIDGNLVDVSRLPVSDRRVFGLSLFTVIEPFHVLDCTANTSPEEALSFVVRFTLMRGRFVIFNFQELGSDVQNQIRKVSEEEDQEQRQLIILITKPTTSDESIDSVTMQECDLRWRRDAHQKVAALRRFATVTYYDQPSGTGKSYTIEANLKESRWGNTSPTRLDLDSTTEPTMEGVCNRLMNPLRAKKGLLIINVGHDTPHSVVNKVLDGLTLLGRISSASGLAVSTPLKGWHLVVEFQETPKDMSPWRTSDGGSDITLLTCRGLAEQGTLRDFDIDDIPHGKDALLFLRTTLGNLPESDNDAVRQIALGGSDSGGCVTPRKMSRAVRFISARYKAFVNSKCSDETELRKLVAVSLKHEAFHHINPHIPDHFHLKTTDSIRTNRIQLAGETPVEIRDAIDLYLSVHVSKVVTKPITERLTDPLGKPMHVLIKILAEELGVKIKSCAQTLFSNGYVLTPDFLQKLIQLSAHVGLCDPVILQGPSGTGKSYAVAILSVLMQIPESRSARNGFQDLTYSLFMFLRRDSTLRKLFPNNVSDQVGDREKVLWIAECRFGYAKCVDCIAVLRDAKNIAALTLVAAAIRDTLGPLINDPRATPEVTELLQSNDQFRHAIDLIIKTTALHNTVSEVFQNLVCIIKEISTLNGGMLTTQIIHCVEGALRSVDMEELMGSDFKTVQSILDKDHLRDAMIEWAKDAVRRAGPNGAALVSHVREHMRSEIRASPILKPKPEFIRTLAEGPSHEADGDELAGLICDYLDMERESTSTNVLIRYNMTPGMLFNEVRPTFERAVKCPEISFVIMIDEMNATNMLGLLKRIIIDRRWELWDDARPSSQGVIPHNISFVGAVNPSKKDSQLEGTDEIDSSDFGFDVTPMSPSLSEHVVPWRQLADDQRQLFISRVIGANKNLFRHQVPVTKVDILSRLLLKAHQFVQKICSTKRSTVSQRDIHRAMKLFDFFFKRGLDFIHLDGELTTNVWDRALTSMILAVAVSYYFRLSPGERCQMSDEMTAFLFRGDGILGSDPADPDFIPPLPEGVEFSEIVWRGVKYFCGPHLILPEAVYAHAGLMENLFVQIVCFDCRLGVILHGPPGTSKTLSNNIIKDNMTGMGEFWCNFANISEVCRYQGSAQSSADEIQRKCEEAYLGQRNHDAHGHSNKRCLLFVDEAGLVKGEGMQRKWALKVLHYYLEGANIASVLMTNQALDPAISNRCIEVYMAKPHTNELSNMCAGILHGEGMQGLTPTAQRIVPLCCQAFHNLLGSEGTTDPSKKARRWWFGLRDLFHMMRYIRRNQPAQLSTSTPYLISITPRLITEALERNFNAAPEMFNEVLGTFGGIIGKENPRFTEAELRSHLRKKLDIVINSISDNNRAAETSAGKNLNDMWVRYKLLVDHTEDGNVLQLLRQSGVRFSEEASVLSLSALCDQDDLMPVTVVSQISAAMETGRTVWLTNTRKVDACLFDVFNQNYIVASNGKGEVLHFVAVAVGGTLEYKRVHKDFQCIVHVTKKEVKEMGKTLPAPFLNRLEKYTISVPEILEHTMEGLSDSAKATVGSLRTKLQAFERTLSVGRSVVFSDNVSDTFDSLLLESVQGGALKPLPISKRLQHDETIQKFLYGDPSAGLWRSISCKILQLMKPEGMLLAQKVLSVGAPAYLRAYFNTLNPWSLTGYLAFLRRSMKDLQSISAWYRAAVYTPANVDLTTLLKTVRGCTCYSVDTLMEAERGQEDLREAIYKFCSDPEAFVFVAVLPATSIGMPESREIRLLLDMPPDTKETTRTSKAVVMIQALSNDLSSGCTPLFGSGWDQLYIDAAAENLGTELKRYVDGDVVGHVALCGKMEWLQIEKLTEQAIVLLMQAQAEHQVKWAEVAKSDPAAVLYDPKGPFEDQVRAAKRLLAACPQVRSVVMELCGECVPEPEELVSMGMEIAGMEGQQESSLAQRLLEGEQKAPCVLLTNALHLLLDDRNASTLLACDSETLKHSDKLISMTLRATSTPTTFDKLRNQTRKGYPPLTVRAAPPTLPGSSALRRVLPISPHATDVVAEMRRLVAEHESTPVGDMVEIVQNDPTLLRDFFMDCIRILVRHSSASVCVQVAEWVLFLARGLHQSIFKKDETVWSIRALCIVEARALEEYIIAFIPLVETGVLTEITPGTGIANKGKRELSWVELDLASELLGTALPYMAENRDKLLKYKAACLTVIGRLGKNSKAGVGRLLPSLSVVCCMISSSDFPVQEVVAFLHTSKVLPYPHIHTPTLRSILSKIPLTTSLVLKALVKHTKAPLATDATSLLPFVLDLISSKNVSRAVACHAMSHLSAFQSIPMSQESAGLLLTAAEKQRGASFKEKGTSGLRYPPPETVQQPGDKVLTADVFLALYDMTVDKAFGLDCDLVGSKTVVEVGKTILTLRESCKTGVGAVLLCTVVQLAAMEQIFMRLLGLMFIRTEDRPNWAPAVLSNESDKALLTKVAKKLMEPTGFKCPLRGSEQDQALFKNPPDPQKDSAVFSFISTLENGLGPIRGMGTKAMLEYLRDQVSNEPSSLGPIVQICGESARHKCQNAEPLATQPGDLPFIYKIHHPLHDLFHTFRRQLQTSQEQADPASLENIVSGVENLVNSTTLDKARLLTFYVGLRCYFGEKQTHPLAKAISESNAVQKLLDLNWKQQRVLYIAFDYTNAGGYCEREVGLVSSLKEGFTNDWVEMVCTVAAVGCAIPESFLGTMLLDAEGLCEKFIPGDKTGSSVAHGGCFKFDCVTQLDESGNIDSCAKGQPVLSTGACYLLWGVEFGALALQLIFFPESFSIMWEWLFSAALHTRMYGYQQGLSDYAHMVNQLTERSMAYHLHMGSHTGLSVDEAQRMYAFFLYHVIESEEEECPLRKGVCITRDEGLSVERSVESFWKTCITEDRTSLSRPETEMCHTIKALAAWSQSSSQTILPRSTELLWSLESLPTEQKPALLDMMLTEDVKLSILPHLILDLTEFAIKVHSLLSGRLPLKYTRNREEFWTPLRSVQGLLKENVPGQKYTEAMAVLKRIKTRWNQFRQNVGPIDYECEEGGINIMMDEHETDPPSLTDTLDFWVIYSSKRPVDSNHKNYIHAALLSLVDKYNKCCSVLEPSPAPPHPIEPAALIPSKPLLLTPLVSPGELARTHVGDTSEEVNWQACESEIQHTYGHMIPNFEVPHIPYGNLQLVFHQVQ